MTSEEANPFMLAEESFWDQYRKGRPPLAESVLQRIWQYHASKGGEFNLVHEPGAGAGIHSHRIANKFKHSIVSDISASNIALAKSHLKDLDNLTFRVGPLEDYEGIEKESVDMILAINCIHFMDQKKMLESVQHQLKPGGTFAALIFCHTVLKDPVAHNIWLRMWWSLLQTRTEKEGLPKDTWPDWYRVVVSGGNAIPFPETVFEAGVQRLRINCDVDLRDAYIVPGKPYEHMPSQVGDKDEIVVLRDDQEGTFKADIKRLEEMTNAVIPMDDVDDEEMKTCWRELVEYVGEREMEGNYLVCGVLATKRKDGGST